MEDWCPHSITLRGRRICMPDKCVLLTVCSILRTTLQIDAQEDRRSHMQTVLIDPAASGLIAAGVMAFGFAPSVRRLMYWGGGVHLAFSCFVCTGVLEVQVAIGKIILARRQW